MRGLTSYRYTSGTDRVDVFSGALIRAANSSELLAPMAHDRGNRLEQSAVLHETTAGKRNRVWESVGLFDLLDRLEREVGDGRRAPACTS